MRKVTKKRRPANNRKAGLSVREGADLIPIADFFAGSGLVTEALKRFFNTVWANDIAENKANVYRANHGSWHFHLGPIQQITGRDIPHVVMSWASFPCQDLSLAGKIHGIHSERSGLVWEWLRILDESPDPPPVLALENVLGLVSAHDGMDYVRLHQALVSRGYQVGPMLLDASRWVPQSRPRVFVVAVRNEIAVPADLRLHGPGWCHNDTIRGIAQICQSNGWIWWKLPQPRFQIQKLSNVVEWDVVCDSTDKNTTRLGLIPPAHKKELYSIIRKNGGRRLVFPGYRRTRNGKQVLELRFDDIAGCLRTPEGGSSRQVLVLVDERGNIRTRLLTVRETARLMGAPDSYKVPGSYNDGYKAMGDAVVVPVVKWLGQFLLLPLCRVAIEHKEPYACYV